MPRPYKNTQFGVEGPEILQDWEFRSSTGTVATRQDENGDRIVLWRDIENMFAHHTPKYARIGDFSVPFHVNQNLEERTPKRISYYPNERIVIVGKPLQDDNLSTDLRHTGHTGYTGYDVLSDPAVFSGLVLVVFFILSRIFNSSSSSSSSSSSRYKNDLLRIELTPESVAALKCRGGNGSCHHCH